MTEQPAHEITDPTDVTIDGALTHAARLLREAEFETDLARKEQDTAIANAWIDLASVLVPR